MSTLCCVTRKRVALPHSAASASARCSSRLVAAAAVRSSAAMATSSLRELRVCGRRAGRFAGV